MRAWRPRVAAEDSGIIMSIPLFTRLSCNCAGPAHHERDSPPRPSAKADNRSPSRCELRDRRRRARLAGRPAAFLPEVRCEISEADDFEARLQTLKRNQHGSHNPLLEGLVFKQMMKERRLSQRKLANQIAISEATIRNRLSYVALREAGVDPAEVGDVRLVEQIQIVEGAPELIRDADFLR